MLLIYNLSDMIGNFSPEKNDIFSLGISFIRVINLWNENKINGLNN